jgi:hypothetical protein
VQKNQTIPNEVIVKPQAGGQWEFLAAAEFETLFGGVAGPGKSWALIIKALGLSFQNTPLGKAAVGVPEYRAVLFRRKTTQFTKLIDEGKKYYTKEPFNAEFIQHRTGDPGPSFNFPSGARIFICHMENELNKEDHQGQEYQFVGFDEVTQFTLTQYLYLFSRCRSTIPYLFPMVNSTTNPTGVSLINFKKRFIKNGSTKLEPNKRYYFKQDLSIEPEKNPMGIMTNDQDQDGLSRRFIPGNLQENKILLESDPGYLTRIKAMGKKFYKALGEGDWDAFGGDFFEFDQDMVIKPFSIPPEWPLYGSMDPGWSSPLSFSLRTKDFEGNVYRLTTYYVQEKNASTHAKNILSLIKTFPPTNGRMPELIVSGVDAWSHKDRFAIVSHELTMFDVFRDHGLYLSKANTDRQNGWGAINQLMMNGKWFCFAGYNEPFIDQVSVAQHSEKNPNDITGEGKDEASKLHCLDEERYGVMAIYTPTEPEEEPPPEPVSTATIMPRTSTKKKSIKENIF